MQVYDGTSYIHFLALNLKSIKFFTCEIIWMSEFSHCLLSQIMFVSSMSPPNFFFERHWEQDPQSTDLQAWHFPQPFG